MRYALHAEWTKLRTLPGIGWLPVVAVALTIGLSALASSAVTCRSGCDQDLTQVSLTGVGLGQAVLAALAVVVISSEYGTGMVRTSLAAMPRRPVVFAAKAVILAGVVLPVGVVAALGSVLIARTALPGGAVVLSDGSTVRAIAGSVLYLALVALLSYGIATVVRDSAAAIGIVLFLLYLFPVLAQVVTSPHWQRHLRQIGPMNAGLAIQATKHLDRLPIGPWAGLGVLTGWAAAALLAGGLLLQFRDA
jgi:ABC-2 type transport system permease protein